MKTARLMTPVKVVTAPDGRTWTVRRRVPRGPRWWRPSAWDVPWDLGVGSADDAAGVVAGIVMFVLLVVVVGVLAFVVLPAVFFVVDALLIVFGLVLLGGAWVVEATTPGPPPETRSWRVRGLFASRGAVSEAARELERGDRAAAPGAAAP